MISLAAEPGHRSTARTEAGARFEAWLHGNLPAPWVDAVLREDWPTVERIATDATADAALRATAAEGWLTPDWPPEYGGLGLDGDSASDIKGLLRHWHVGDVRIAIGTAWVGPTLVEWGTGEQRATLLPPIARADELWCQLFSEPDAGSDLASLRTTATRQPGGAWHIDGTKLWTSRADIAQRGLLIARSDPSAPKHRGLTAFCVDMSAPGVTVRPIRQMTGDAEFFEVLLDGVALEDRARIGPEGAGWDVCRTALAFERVAGSGVGAAPPGSVVGRSIEELVSRCRGLSRLDPVHADALVREWIDATVILLTNRRAAARHAAGLQAGTEGSVTKVLQALHAKRLQRLFVDLAGPSGVAWDEGDAWSSPNSWAFLRVQAKTIAGGTTEVLKNQLAERVLGLPRDEDPTRSQPWADTVASLGRGSPPP